jgi:hypothetical protein
MLILVAAFVLLSAALYAWGIWVERRHGTLIYRLAARGVLVGIVFGLGGLSWALWRIDHAEEAARMVDPTAAAAQLAGAISGTVAMAAIPVALGNLILLGCIVVFVLGTTRHRLDKDEVDTRRS